MFNLFKKKEKIVITQEEFPDEITSVEYLESFNF